MITRYADTREDRGDYERSCLLGPSVQFRPLPALTINIEPLFGITGDSPEVRAFYNFGWEF